MTITTSVETTAIPIIEKIEISKLHYITDADYTLMEPVLESSYSVRLRTPNGTEQIFRGIYFQNLNIGDTVSVNIYHHLIGETIEVVN